MASKNQTTLIQSLVTWASQCCYAQFTATTYEDVIRGRILDRALLAGWTIAINKGTPIYELSFDDGKIIQGLRGSFEEREGNPDIRIAKPFALVAELKIRGNYGSAMTRPTINMSKDFDHVTEGNADVFVLAADLEQYKLMRDGTAGTTFPNELPDFKDLRHQPFEHTSEHNGVEGCTLAQIVSSPFGERVVAAFYLPS